MPTCNHPDCDGVADKTGWCSAHWSPRVQRTVDEVALADRHNGIDERSAVRGSSPCGVQVPTMPRKGVRL